MSNIYTSIQELIGKTPLLELTNIQKNKRLNARIIAKLEYLNPAGSVKDRVALSIIEDAEAKGTLKSDSVIIEPTSGNTGIGLAAVACSRGYRVIIVMPDSMSEERRKTLKAYGAELILTDGSAGMKGAIQRAEQIAKNTPNSFIAGQFLNPANAAAHRKTTGPEIYADTDGTVDIFVAGVGTGGTITGVGEFLKSKNSNIKIVAVEPEKSPVLSGGMPSAHGLQGIGAGFIPKIINREIIDEVITVNEEEAYYASRLIARSEGILVGISSGAALSAAIMLAKMPENAGKNIVVLLADTGDRYLSTALFDD